MVGNIEFAILLNLCQCCIRVAESGGECDRGPHGCRRPAKSWELRELIAQRKGCSDPALRQELSKSINRLSKRELRRWKSS